MSKLKEVIKNLKIVQLRVAVTWLRVAVSWLLMFYNNCLYRKQIPKAWRKTKVIAIHYPGNVAADAKIYRPVFLLYHLYKIFAKMLLNCQIQI